MAEIPTAERRRTKSALTLAVVLVAFLATALLAMPTSSAKSCPPGLSNAPGLQHAPGIQRAPGLPNSNSPVIGCLAVTPTTATPTTATPTTKPTVATTTTTAPLRSTTTTTTKTVVVVTPTTAAPTSSPAVPLPRTVTRRPVRTTVTTTPPVLALTEPPEITVHQRRARPAVTEPENDDRPFFVASIPRPSEVVWSVGQVSVNAALALGLVLLLGLPAEILNSALKARLAMKQRRRRVAWFAALEDRVNQLPDPILLVGFGALSALVYSQLDPSMGFDGDSLLFMAALAAALVVVTGTLEAVRIPYLSRRHDVGSHLAMFPKALLIAVVLVVVSRLTSFHPGFIFGVTCGLTVSGRLRDEDEGRSIAVACAALLALAAVAWVAWIPAADAASKSDPSSLAVVFDTFLATLWVTGLQVVLFGLLPIQFLYGEKVLAWSRKGWLALYGIAMFLFVQTLFHPSADEWGGFSTGTMVVIAVSGVVLLLGSISFWVWVKRHPIAPLDVRDDVIDLVALEREAAAADGAVTPATT
jgi:hypothetical protein